MRPNRTRAWLVAPSLLVAMTSTGCQLVADVDRQDIAGETDLDFDGGTGDAGGDGDASHDADGADGDVACTTPSDCPGSDDECQQRTCEDGVCGTSFTAEGTPLTAQDAGDCAKIVCDGNGGTKAITDDEDLPDDDNPCTDDICEDGSPEHLPVGAGAPCGSGLSCDGAGACVGCVAPTDCPGSDDECRTRTCDEGVCGFDFAPEGTEVSAQTAGDCKKDVCDGAGNTVAENDDTDVPLDDGNPCTVAVCAEGVGHHVPGNDGAACSDGDACTQVDSCQNGICVGALPITCFPRGECHLAGVCDPATGQCSDPIAENGTACNDGNACTQTDTCFDGVCFGSNPVICQAQDQCHTAGTCNHLTGLCSNPVAQEGTACNENGGTSCDGEGNCVAAAAVTATTPADGSSAKASTLARSPSVP